MANWNSGEEKGKQDYISMRVGHDFPNWQGVQDDPDTSTLSPGALSVGENCRLRARGKFISERPGVTQLNSTAMNSGAAIVGIYDERVWAGLPGDGLASGRGVRMLTAHQAMPKSFGGSYADISFTPASSGAGSIGTVDETLSSVVQEVCRASSTRVYGPLFMDTDGTVYCGLMELSGSSYVPYLGCFKPTPVKDRTDALVSLQPAPAKLCRIPMAVLGTQPYYPVITSITRVGPYIFVGVTGYKNTDTGSVYPGSPDGGSAGIVYRWDGKSLTSDHSVAVVSDATPRVLRVLLFPYGELLVASFFQANNYNESTNEVFKVRSEAGVWSTITNSMTPTIDLSHAHPMQLQHQSAVYKDNLYVGGADTALSGGVTSIAKYDRTSLTTARAIADISGTVVTNDGIGVTGLTVSPDGAYLYYLHSYRNNLTTVNTTYLGRFDGSSWNDVYATVYAGAQGTTQRIGKGLVQQNGKLYALLRPAGEVGDNDHSLVVAASVSAPTSWSTVTDATDYYGWPLGTRQQCLHGWAVPV